MGLQPISETQANALLAKGIPLFWLGQMLIPCPGYKNKFGEIVVRGDNYVWIEGPRQGRVISHNQLRSVLINRKLSFIAQFISFIPGLLSISLLFTLFLLPDKLSFFIFKYVDSFISYYHAIPWILLSVAITGCFLPPIWFCAVTLRLLSKCPKVCIPDILAGKIQNTRIVHGYLPGIKLMLPILGDALFEPLLSKFAETVADVALDAGADRLEKAP